MADYYCDQGAYASALGAVPTWGVPQEGDGSTKDAATASAVASVQFTANATGGSSSISICGVTFTATTHFAVGASLSATLDNLVAAINANSGQGAVTVAAAVAFGTPKLCNLVYARKTGTDTLEVMSRIGSAQTNNATNSNWALTAANWTNNGITNFAGGSGGCWGWFLNGSAIGVSSSIAALNYGVMATKPYVSVSAFADVDVINVRTGRNLTVTPGNVTWGALSTRSTYANFLFDDGTIWTGDSASAKFTVDWAVSNVGLSWSAGSQYTTYKCRQLGGLTVKLTNVSAGNIAPIFAYNGSTYGAALEKVAFIEQAHAYPSSTWQIQPHPSTSRFEFSAIGCLFDFSAVQRTNLVQPFLNLQSNGAIAAANGFSYNFTGNDFRWSLTGVGAAAISVPFSTLVANDKSFSLTARGNTFTTGSSLDLPIVACGAYTCGNGVTVIAENNKGAGLPAGAVGINASAGSTETALIFLDNLAIGGASKYETRAGYCEFNVGQPVLSSVSTDGTVYSWLAYWTNAAQSLTPGRPFKLPASRIQSRLSTAVRNWSIELLLDSVSLAQLPTYGVVEVEYVTGSGVPVCERTQVSLAASSASWSNVASAPYNTWTAKKVSGVTSQSVPTDSIMSIRIVIERPAQGGSTASFALNPEASIT